ncbi:MAG: 2-oxoglutarate oxidoreductase [Candidatus Omnitrophica bacterium]|nr:2-oxoglutarate oxidoreductase [Candidatus Omnitrophota bacterium]MBU1128883.1 2-oxoglutarate oxidoreductase [Candidatus Omnitrophota bacterium]MBU1784470.1 2-oxoglutarate oxidoreductase [Candidatus Omnitrophota bacterium]MBU1851940.1 2-oxoglutarate oxidoreductase [Candidatus Omnitrophota bacterium]
MGKTYTRPNSMKDVLTHYCPGCGHGMVHRIICEVIDELDVRETTIAVAPVGCAVLAYDYWNFDTTEAAHGRTPAVATGIKRIHPDKLVFTYQGDGDLAAIGTAETIHAGNRGENISIIFVNNGVYGMTGGQMAPTTILGQITATSPYSRRSEKEGFPLKIMEMMAVLPGVTYLERTMLTSPKEVIKTKKAIKRSFKRQLDKKGFSMVEILSPCPTYWGLSPLESIKRIENEVVATYPVGVIKEDK